MNDIVIKPRTACPLCRRQPHVWKEQPKFGSRELFWVGCQTDSKLVGAITQPVALDLWERLAARLKFDRDAK